MILNKSNISLYRKCPKAFYYAYIKKLPGRPPSKEMFVGEQVHLFARDMWDKNFLKVVNDEVILDYTHPHDEVNRHIKNIVEIENKRWKLCKEKSNPEHYFFPVLVEKKIVLPELNIDGIVDRVSLELDDEYSLVEMKTGRAIMNGGLMFELNFYKYLVDSSRILDKRIKRGIIYFTSTNEVICKKLKEPWQIKKMVKTITEKIDSNIFPMNVTPLCSWCDYKEICLSKYYKLVGVKDVQPISETSG